MKRWFLTLLFLLVSTQLFAQTCPPFPQRGIEIIDRMYDQRLAQGSDDDRRLLTRSFIEEFVFEFPGDGWTWKSADGGRPASKDSIARVFNGRLCNWDWQNGSTRARSVQAGQLGDDITGQNPIAVPGVNHLGSVLQPPTVPLVPPPPAAGTDGEMLSWMQRIYDQAERIFALEAKAEAEAHAKTQSLVGQVDVHLTQHDTDPTWFRSVAGFLMKPTTLTAITGIVGVIVARQTAPNPQPAAK